MRWLLVVGVMGATLFFASTRSFAEIKKMEKEELFSIQGTLIQVETGEKMFLLKNEGGLELTFRVNEGTEIKIGQGSGLLSHLAAGDSVEVDYIYNENYEKVARSIRKLLKT